MNEKQAIITKLRDELTCWEELLARLSEEQMSRPNVYGYMSVKEVLLHLWVWQQVSIARLEAGLENREPVFPEWFARDPDSDEERDEINAGIFNQYQAESWASIHGRWREGFLRFIELGEMIPESDLYDTEKYSWLQRYSLFDVLDRSFEHHHEDHLKPLLAAFPPAPASRES